VLDIMSIQHLLPLLYPFPVWQKGGLQTAPVIFCFTYS